MGGGHFQDGSTFARQLYDKNVPLNFVSLLVAPPEPDFADLGDAPSASLGPANGAFGGLHARVSQRGGVEWFGPLGGEFVKAYEAAYNGEEPPTTLPAATQPHDPAQGHYDCRSTDPKPSKMP